MDERNAIGVVGGLGPYAGLDLVKKIFDNTHAASDQEHLPVVLISYPGHVPDRSAYLADQTQPNPIPPLAEILRRLEGAGCAIAGMPCNTAHNALIFDALNETMEREGRRIRLLNMIEACAEACRERVPDAKRVGVLATTSSVQNRLHAHALEQLGLEAVRPDWDFQDAVINPTIFHPEWGLKAQSDPPTAQAREHLLDGIRYLKARGADAVILGCTELPLAVPEPVFENVPLVDSTDTLARALIRAAFPERLRPSPRCAEATGSA